MNAYLVMEAVSSISFPIESETSGGVSAQSLDSGSIISKAGSLRPERYVDSGWCWCGRQGAEAIITIRLTYNKDRSPLEQIMLFLSEQQRRRGVSFIVLLIIFLFIFSDP
jgi:hypothetical protein